VGDWAAIQHNHFIAQQLDYHPAREQDAAEACRVQMNAQQVVVYQNVLQCIDNGGGGLFFLNRPGGTGKTFVYQALSHAICGQGKIVLCVASSGIASILLPGGQTSHSCFRIPLDVGDTSHCNIPKNGLKADLLKQTVAIIWDEVPMQHRYCMEAVDHTLRDVLDSDSPFGGIEVLWGGDFRQILPVVEKGSREDIVFACIQCSCLWQHGGVEYTKSLPDHVRVGGSTAEEALESLLDATYPGISDSKNWFTFGKIFLARPIVAQITKLDLWEFSVTKQSIMALFIPNVKTLASCIDLIQDLQ